MGQRIPLWVFLGTERWWVIATFSDLRHRQKEFSLLCSRLGKKDASFYGLPRGGGKRLEKKLETMGPGQENMLPRLFWGCHLRVCFPTALHPLTHLPSMFYSSHPIPSCVYIGWLCLYYQLCWALFQGYSDAQDQQNKMPRLAISSLRKLR